MVVSTKKKINQFSLDSFEAFKPFINLYGCGQAVQDWDHKNDLPIKTTPFLIAKETKALFERYQQGERGLTYEDGSPFQPWHFMAGKLDAKKVDRHIFGKDTFYYTSGTGRFGLSYFDVDAHFEFQTDHERARQLLIELLGPDNIFFRDSGRGQNGYIKIYHDGHPAIFNALLDDLARAIKLWLRYHGILADIEIKGHCHLGEKYGRLAKLPFTTHLPSQKKESWNYTMLRDFQGKKVLTLGHLRYFIRQVQAQTDVENALAFDCHVEELKRREKWLRKALANKPSQPDYAAIEEEPTIISKENDHDKPPQRAFSRCTPKLPERAGADAAGEQPAIADAGPDVHDCCHRVPGCEEQGIRPGNDPDAGLAGSSAELPARAEQEKRAGGKRHARVAWSRSIEALRAIPDSFQRQFDAGLLLTRMQGRVPTKQELLDFIQDNDLFTGDWDENDGRREARVAWIVHYISQTFDLAKCRSSTGSVDIDVEKYRAWARERFSSKISVERQSIDEFMQGHTTKGGFVTCEDVAVYLAIFEFCLENGQYLHDQGIPHARIVGLWQSLYTKGTTKRSVSDRKVSVVREMLASREVIQVIDRDFRPGKSMRYDYGKFFPFKGRWKERQDKQKQRLAIGDMTTLCIIPVVAAVVWKEKKEKELNYSTYASRSLLGNEDDPRPPPDSS